MIYLNILGKAKLTLDQYASQGGSIYCFDCILFWTYGLQISDSTAYEGGALSLEFSTQTQEQETGKEYYNVKIVNSTFKNCKAQIGNGGAILIKNVINNLISGSTFTNNWGVFGGALYHSCSEPYICELIFNGSNLFENNSANISGGGIYWNDVQPILSENASMSYSNNSARIYGDNISSYPQRITKISSVQYQDALKIGQQPAQIDSEERLLYFQFRRDNRMRTLQVEGLQNSSFERNLRSGGELPEMYLALTDPYGQIAATESSKKLDISIKLILNETEDSQLYDPEITGITTFFSQNGVYKIANVTFTATPGCRYQLSFVSEGIDTTKPANKQYLNDIKGNLSESIDFQLDVELRSCLAGESFSNSGVCEECEEDKYFSLIQMTEPGLCQSCPTSQAICNGGSKIGPQPGFWRRSNKTQTFIKCFNAKACLGMIPPRNEPIGECDAGYQGILCANCKPGYSVTSSFKCAKCPPFKVNMFRIIAIFVGAVIVVAFMVRSTMRGAANSKNITSVFQKILLNHIQLIMLTASFDFNWPQMVLDYFNVNEAVGDSAYQIFSIDCFLSHDAGYDVEKLRSELDSERDSLLPIRKFYFKLSLFTLLPMILACTSYLVWRLIYIKGKQGEKMFTSFVSSIVILLFLVHPNIVRFVFNAFNCVDIDGEERLKNDLEIVCYSGQHTPWAFAVALPALIAWGIGIPFFSLGLLIRVKTKLSTLEIKQKYGFLFRGYKLRFYYWESVIIYRKILLIFIQVFLVKYGVAAQALTVLLLLIFFMGVNLTKNPFATVTLNQLEITSIVTSILTIFCGLFFIVSVDSTDVTTGYTTSSSQVVLDSKTKFLLFLVIVVSNVVFFTFFVFKMYVQLKNRIIKNFPRIYTSLCLCGEYQRYNLLLQQIEIIEDNNILREQFTESLRQLEQLIDEGKLILNQKSLEKVLFYLRKDRVLEAAGPPLPIFNQSLKIGNKQSIIWKLRARRAEKSTKFRKTIAKEQLINMNDSQRILIKEIKESEERSTEEMINNFEGIDKGLTMKRQDLKVIEAKSIMADTIIVDQKSNSQKFRSSVSSSTASLNKSKAESTDSAANTIGFQKRANNKKGRKVKVRINIGGENIRKSRIFQVQEQNWVNQSINSFKIIENYKKGQEQNDESNSKSQSSIMRANDMEERTNMQKSNSMASNEKLSEDKLSRPLSYNVFKCAVEQQQQQQKHQRYESNANDDFFKIVLDRTEKSIKNLRAEDIQIVKTNKGAKKIQQDANRRKGRYFANRDREDKPYEKLRNKKQQNKSGVEESYISLGEKSQNHLPKHEDLSLTEIYDQEELQHSKSAKQQRGSLTDKNDQVIDQEPNIGFDHEQQSYIDQRVKQYNQFENRSEKSYQ